MQVKITRSAQELNKGTVMLVLSHSLKCAKVWVASPPNSEKKMDDDDLLPATSQMLLIVGKTASFVCFSKQHVLVFRQL